ncbi:hypothetical protein ACFX2I_022419 [Malus domestica]
MLRLITRRRSVTNSLPALLASTAPGVSAPLIGEPTPLTEATLTTSQPKSHKEALHDLASSPSRKVFCHCLTATVKVRRSVLKEPSAQFWISHSFDIVEPQPSALPPMFNPLATKAATICLTIFGPGGPFSFDAWKKQQRKSNSSKKDSNHEALGNEWLQSGSCLIAKLYGAVSSVILLVAKVLQPPPGMKLKCPPAALSQTVFAKNLRPQPLPAKVLVIRSMGMAVNVPLGITPLSC